MKSGAGRVGDRQALNARPIKTSKIPSILFFCLLLAPVVYGAEQQKIPNEDCLACHDQIDPAKYGRSIHGKNLCTSCHADIIEIPHQEKPAPVQCANCHPIEAEIYRASDHGIAEGRGSRPRDAWIVTGNRIHFSITVIPSRPSTV